MSTTPMDTTVAETADSEHTFWLFATEREASFFNRWYLAPLLIYLLFVICDVLFDYRLAVLSQACPTTSAACPHAYSDPEYLHVKLILTSGIFLLSAAILTVTILLFNRWRQTIPATFEGLQSRKRICATSKGVDEQVEYRCFLKAYKQALQSPRRFLLAGVIALVFAALNWISDHSFMVGSQHASDIYLGAVQWAVGMLRVLVIPLFFGYFFGVVFWSIAMSALFVKRYLRGRTEFRVIRHDEKAPHSSQHELPDAAASQERQTQEYTPSGVLPDRPRHAKAFQFALYVEPGHPDNSGGLKSLGSFCLNMAVTTLATATLFGIFGIGYTVYGYVLESVRAQKTLDPNVFSAVALIVLALVPAAIVFLSPLLPIHHDMVDIKETYQDMYTRLTEQLEGKITALLEEGKLKPAREAQEELKMVQDVLHPDTIGYPTWPFDSRILNTFLIAQIPAIVSLGISLLFPGKPPQP